jgi:purine-binding chemotaxis protein CheW
MPVSQTSVPLLLARIDGTQVAFSASAVREIVRAVAIAPLSGAPGVIEGAINLHGRIVPVVDVRQRLALPAVAVSPDQYLIALQTSDRLIAVRVDDVEDVIEVAESSMESPSSLSPVLEWLQGVAAIASGALVIYDVDAFLTQAEQEALDAAALVTG